MLRGRVSGGGKSGGGEQNIYGVGRDYISGDREVHDILRED